MIKAKILLDSCAGNHRLTTMELTYPRFILAEVNTHRVFSRNTASSRAIPVEKMIQRVIENPVIPMYWGAAQKGMQAHQEVDIDAKIDCEEAWLSARDEAVKTVRRLLSLGLHKQIPNRLLEPWMWVTSILSSTEWANFFNLRCHKMAEPHMQALAYAMRDAYYSSQPTEREWHCPLSGFPGDETLSESDLRLVSVARCARVSYLTHEGLRDVGVDLRLSETLRSNGHFSPWEHCAKSEPGRHGNFIGWKQLRWFIEKGLPCPS